VGSNIDNGTNGQALTLADLHPDLPEMSDSERVRILQQQVADMDLEYDRIQERLQKRDLEIARLRKALEPKSSRGSMTLGEVKRSQTFQRLWTVLEMHRSHDRALERAGQHRRVELCEALTLEVEAIIKRKTSENQAYRNLYSRDGHF
jgi:hypothetical protein